MQKTKRLVVFSRHPSHNALRRANVILPVRASIRLGSTNQGTMRYAVELNKPEAVRISSNKLLMKQKFTEADINTARWWTLELIPTDSGNTNYFCNLYGIEGNINTGNSDNCYHAELPYPIVAKSLHGSRGLGNHLLNTKKELETWGNNKDLSNYIFEKYYSYSREYRLHVSGDGCFYTCRKMLKTDTPADKRWYRNDSNSVWVLEDNKSFNKPTTWDAIVADCVKGLNTIGLDVAAFDVKVEAKDKNRFIIIESNSAPSFGELTLQKYIEEIPKIINKKLNN